MPTKPPRLCPRCKQPVKGGPCPRCHPAWGNAPVSWQQGSTSRWRRLRAAHLQGQPWCVAIGCQQLATDVDHVVPLSQGGERYDAGNLQSMCRRHHQQKTAHESADARRG